MRYLLLLFFIALFISCEDDVVVKPSAKLRLEYPQGEYKRVNIDCPFSFSKNTQTTVVKKTNCGLNIKYPNMKATLYMTYQRINNNNLDSLLYDAQKLTYDHTVKAKTILEQPRVDSINKVYGMLYMIDGNAATQSQFYVTDSINHFVTGSVYFDAKPNFDSIYPAVIYLREDIRTIMETIKWENK
jgi:gliding motility-associated lipoprotein GldD